MIIRNATEDDLPQMALLLGELGYACTIDELRGRYSSFLSNSGFGVVVCEANSDVTGLLAWSRTQLFISEKKRFHVEALVVSEDHRGKGIGKKLMAFLEDLAQENTPAIIDLTSGLRRSKDGSHDFYNKLGYQNEGPMAKVYLRKDLCSNGL